MKLAAENGIKSIAFPSISTGVYDFPVDLAAKIAVGTVKRFLDANPGTVEIVEWVLFDDRTYSYYRKMLRTSYNRFTSHFVALLSRNYFVVSDKLYYEKEVDALYD